MDYTQLIENQREFFRTHQTKDIRFRKEQLIKLQKLVSDNEKALYEAIHKDFGKSAFDTFTTEISIINKEIEYFLRNLSQLAKPERKWTNLANLPGSSRVYSEPLGTVLVIGAWNYPIQLSLLPAISAIAAGNTVILKPSEIAHHTMLVIQNLINQHFKPDFFHVCIGGVEETTEILKQKFDKIFFTGSTQVGKIVYEAAAKNLTPVVLELGGKSPAIVTADADLEVAARRIVWGKFINAGQTCVAPDFVLVEEKIKDHFLDYLRDYIKKFDYKAGSEHYAQIINDKNYARLMQQIDRGKIYFGGNTDPGTRYIEPTVLDNVNWDDEVMREEIFGPILPVVSYKYFREAMNHLAQLEKPLAAYLFSNNPEEIKFFKDNYSFGGGCINDVMMHLSNDALPFGGVGNSGIGNYHGKYGFEAFSHKKAVLHRKNWGEPAIKYPPYTAKKLSLIRKLLSW